MTVVAEIDLEFVDLAGGPNSRVRVGPVILERKGKTREEFERVLREAFEKVMAAGFDEWEANR